MICKFKLRMCNDNIAEKGNTECASTQFCRNCNVKI